MILKYQIYDVSGFEFKTYQSPRLQIEAHSIIQILDGCCLVLYSKFFLLEVN